MKTCPVRTRGLQNSASGGDASPPLASAPGAAAQRESLGVSRSKPGSSTQAAGLYSGRRSPNRSFLSAPFSRRNLSVAIHALKGAGGNPTFYVKNIKRKVSSPYIPINRSETSRGGRGSPPPSAPRRPRVSAAKPQLRPALPQAAAKRRGSSLPPGRGPVLRAFTGARCFAVPSVRAPHRPRPRPRPRAPPPAHRPADRPKNL